MSRSPGTIDIHEQPHTATLLDERDQEDRQLLEKLRADAGIEFIDTLEQQRESLARLRPAVSEQLRDEPHRWAYYPWRRTVVSILGPASFALLRLDRNRNLITAAEQDRLGQLRVGVVGLSVGHAIAHTIALQGVAGRLRLADFDELELSNLNRVPATVFDLGVNKAIIAARRIAELNPYLPVEASTGGLSADTVDDFLDGLDVVIEECDSLDMKLVVREAARARRIPVLMSTGDRGLLDVERFDLEPERPILHDLLRGLESAHLAGLSTRDKIPHLLRFLEVSRSSARGAASMLEVNSTLTTWPQLAGEVILGATSVVEGVRRIGLGEDLRSGRIRIDIGAALDNLEQPEMPVDFPAAEPVSEPGGAGGNEAGDPDSNDVVGVLADAAVRAPSGGNTQPWRITASPGTLTVAIAPERTSLMDVEYRASAVALGASVFNARVAAAALQRTATVEFTEPSQDDDRWPLSATVRLSTSADTGLAALYEPMLARSTNRHLGTPRKPSAGTAELLAAAATGEGAALRLLTDRDTITDAARILAAADRIRYLTGNLHRDMISELRWPDDPDPNRGIEVISLGLDRNDLVMLDILRRHDVMDWLAAWEGGSSLGDDTFDRVTSSSALAVVTIDGDSLTDYARGGAAVEAVWIAAQQLGFGVQPVSPVFLYAHDNSDLTTLSPQFAEQLGHLQTAFQTVAGTTGSRSALVLRLSDTPRAPFRSRREAYTRKMVEA
ncbi:MAG: Rv1355c family protein [Mycobacterium sp.]